MDLDQQIFILRKFRKTLQTEENKPFIFPTNHTCLHFDWQNNGYFRRSNGDYCKIEDPNEADFMVMECSCCHQSFYLMNTGATNWDTIPNKEKSPTKIRT